VRCGTNFLLIVMVLTILVYAVFPAKGLLWGILSRVIAIPNPVYPPDAESLAQADVTIRSLDELTPELIDASD